MAGNYAADNSPERVGILESQMERIVHDLYGNGQPGFVDVVRDFISRSDERAMTEEKHRNKRDQEIKDHLESSDRKRNLQLSVTLVVIALLTLAVGAMAYYEGQRQIHGNFSASPSPTVLSSTQDAGTTGSGYKPSEGRP